MVSTIGFGAGERVIVVVGLVVAVAAGIAAGGFESLAAQTSLYALSSLGWIVATAILASHHLRNGESMVAAGFLILTIAETLLWVNGYPGGPGYESGFAGGSMFYVPGVLLVCAPTAYPLLTRVLGMVAGALWAVGAVRFLTGSEFAHTDPLAVAGYVAISAFFLGVAWVTYRGSTAPQPARAVASSVSVSR